MLWNSKSRAQTWVRGLSKEHTPLASTGWCVQFSCCMILIWSSIHYQHDCLGGQHPRWHSMVVQRQLQPKGSIKGKIRPWAILRTNYLGCSCLQAVIQGNDVGSEILKWIDLINGIGTVSIEYVSQNKGPTSLPCDTNDNLLVMDVECNVLFWRQCGLPPYILIWGTIGSWEKKNVGKAISESKLKMMAVYANYQ